MRRLHWSEPPAEVVGTRWSSASVSEFRSAACVENVDRNFWSSAKSVSRHSPSATVPSRPPTATAPYPVRLNWSGVPLPRSSS